MAGSRKPESDSKIVKKRVLDCASLSAMDAIELRTQVRWDRAIEVHRANNTRTT